MAILGITTSLGIQKTKEATLNEGFYIYPLTFGVSSILGALDVSRVDANAGLFYEAPISARIEVDFNTIKYVCTVPQGVTVDPTDIKEMYIFAEDINGDRFLLALGQSTDTLIYEPNGTITLELQLSLADVNQTENYLFTNTQATEIKEHEIDPNAHPELAKALAEAGIYIPLGAYPFKYFGQNRDDYVEFEGTKATNNREGVIFTSTYNGTELNGKVITFDGVKTIDEIRAEFNEANFPNTIEHDGVGTEVLTSGSITLASGTYITQDRKPVYKDIDGIWKGAIADGTIRTRAAGISYIAEKKVIINGLVEIDTGYPISTPVFLSGTTQGAYTDFNTGVDIGISLGNYMYFMGYNGELSASASQEFDAIVTNAIGLGQYARTQDAIDAVPQGGRILINKLEEVKETIKTRGKNLEIRSNSPLNGWKWFEGLNTIFKIEFDLVPDLGNFRIEWNYQETNDIDFADATAQKLQDEFNLLNGHNGVTVTGDFANGFIFSFNDLEVYPLPTFNFAGRNEIQKFNFSNIPDDGTIRYSFEGEETLNFPWDDSTADLKLAMEDLSTITNLDVTGSFAQKYFQFEFKGGFLEDGNKPREDVLVVACDLDLGGVDTDVNGTTVTPIHPETIQQGKHPASNLYNGTQHIGITTVYTQVGEKVGEPTCIEIDSDKINLTGMGKCSGFETGIVLKDSSTKVDIKWYFENVVKPMETLDKISGIDFNTSHTLGYAQDLLSQLRITEHATNKKRVVITGATQLLANGTNMVQEINNLLMDFEGAEIDFPTGKIYKSDGVTELGLEFIPVIPSAEKFRWFSVNIIPKELANDEALTAQVLILPAKLDGDSRELAIKAPFNGKPIGAVCIEGDLGEKEITKITTVKDEYGSLKQKTFIVGTPSGTVAFWFKDETLDTLQVNFDNGITGSNSDAFDSDARKVLATKFSLSSAIDVDRLSLFLKKTGTPSGTFNIRILGESGGEPDLSNVIEVVTNAVNLDNVPTNFNTPIIVDLANAITLNAGVYFIEIDSDNYDFTNGNLLWQSEDVVVPSTKAFYDGGSFYIEATNAGAYGNEAYIVPDGVKDVDTLVSEANTSNSSDIVVVSGGTVIPTAPIVGELKFLDGGTEVDGKRYAKLLIMHTEIIGPDEIATTAWAFADTLGAIGNNIQITGDGVESFTNLLNDWNTNNPSNTATLVNDQGVTPNNTVTTNATGGSDAVLAPYSIYNREPSSATWNTSSGDRLARVRLIETIKGYPALALSADREVEITTIVDNDLQETVANKVKDAMDADGSFDVTVTTNKVVVTNAVLGDSDDIDLGDSGFFGDILQQGRDTDSTGLADISNYHIVQLGTGSGGGSGAGDASDYEERIKNRLNLTDYRFGYSNIFKLKFDTLIDDNSTASFSIVNSNYEFENVGDVLLSNGIFESAYLDNSRIAKKIELSAFIDVDNYGANAVYEMSLDGISYEQVSMSRVGNSDVVRGNIELDDNLNSSTKVVGNTNGTTILDTTENYVLYNVANNTRYLKVLLDITKNNNADGFIYVEVVEDDGSGNPSNVSIAKSKFINVQNLVAGLNNLEIDMDMLNHNSAYHVVLKSDSLYKTTYSNNNLDNIEFASDANGLCLSLVGYEQDLRLRVTRGSDELVLNGFGVLYSYSGISEVIDGTIDRHEVSFQGDVVNQSVFDLPFVVNPRLLMVFDIGTAQVYRYGTKGFLIDSSNKVVFEDNTFNRPELVTLEFVQFMGSTVDQSDELIATMALAHIGSPTSNSEYLVAGRGLYLRRPDGTIREITIDDNDELQVYSI